MALVPFAPGPPRPKQVLSLGFYRTGSHSLKEALTILGYRDVFHCSAMIEDVDKWRSLDAAADDNIACLPSYTGHTWTRRDWDAFLGPCEALTDVTPFAESLVHAYPEARVILVHRAFDAWADSFEQTLVAPSSEGLLARLCGNVLEPWVLGVSVSQTVWKMYMGLLGVCDVRKARSREVLSAAYRRHYDNVRRLVPAERLLEIDLTELEWAPLCRFLGREVPDVPFPRLNESPLLRGRFRRFHLYTLRKAGWRVLLWGLGMMCLWVLFR